MTLPHIIPESPRVIGPETMAPWTAHTRTLTGERDLPPPIPFAPVPPNSRKPYVLSASVSPTRTWGSAARKHSVTESQPSAPATSLATLLTARASPSVLISNFPKPVPASTMASATVVLGVGPNNMALSTALADRRTNPVTPLIFSGWHLLMHKHNLVHKYPNVLSTLQIGAVIGVPQIHHTFIPLNKPSIVLYSTQFDTILQHEYSSQRHIGPFTRAQLEAAIGPFQTSLLSIILKPNKPGKFRMVQDFSFPHTPSSPIPSINTQLDSSLYPCTWGTFTTMALCIARLPPGSQAAARDEAEAYRTIPLHQSQWNGTVVRVGDDAFNLDTCLSFGLTLLAGIYGTCADAANDIMWAEGIGPIIKWVDDRVFFRILKTALADFNLTRAHLHAEITQNGARHHNGGRWWYHAGHLPDGRIIECDEDMAFPLKDLSNTSPRSAYEASFTYGMEDIDRIAAQMGIPWEKSKDIPFGTVIHYIGLEWDIAQRTVALPHDKKEKYQAAISAWTASTTHTLDQVQSLYGKLLHACHIIPAGRAYLTRLENFMGNFHNSPFQTLYPSKRNSHRLKLVVLPANYFPAHMAHTRPYHSP